MNSKKTRLILKKSKANFSSVKLRKVGKKDLILLRNWRNLKQIFPYNSQFYLLNMVHQKKWFEEVNKANSDRKMFIITFERKPVGVCGLIHIDRKNRSADIAIIIGEIKIQGKGLGIQSLEKLLEYGFKKLKLNRIGADVFEFNSRSLKLFQQLNFNHEITYRNAMWRDGKWWNVYGFSLLKNEFFGKNYP